MDFLDKTPVLDFFVKLLSDNKMTNLMRPHVEKDPDIRCMPTADSRDASVEQGDFDAQARDRLTRHFRGHGLDFDPRAAIARLSGGFANRNYRTMVNGREVVLRRPPDGPLPHGAHDMGREHKILSRLCHALPFIPAGLHLCTDLSVIGVPFQLIEYRRGVSLNADTIARYLDRPDVPKRLCTMLIGTLAQLHAVDAEAIGLGDLGRPDGFIARGIAGWAKRGALIAAGSLAAPRIETIAARLNAYSFAARAPVLLHCDFKLDNLLLDPDTLEPVALVDWDMGTRGDPLFDLATLLSYWTEPNDPAPLHDLRQMPTTRPGFWSRAEAAERYAQATGRAIGDLNAMYALAILKLGVVFLQLHAQWATGAVSDPRYAGFGSMGAAIIELADEASRSVTRTM